MAARDLSGQRFDRLTALYPLKERRDNCVLWLCRCDCGATKAIPSTDLLRGRVKSCGCLKRGVKVISGQRRGHLTALAPTGRRDAAGKAVYLWRCDCGNEFERSVRGTARDTARLCPECQARVKARLIQKAREGRAEEASTGLTPAYLRNLVSGVVTRKNTSGIRGVHWNEGHQRWVATGRRNGKPVTLGEFRELREAREARESFVRTAYANAALRLGIEVQ